MKCCSRNYIATRDGDCCFDHSPDCPKLRPFPIQQGGSIPWWLAEVAFEYYHEHWKGQSLERLGERGGFGTNELLNFIRRLED